MNLLLCTYNICKLCFWISTTITELLTVATLKRRTLYTVCCANDTGICIIIDIEDIEQWD